MREDIDDVEDEESGAGDGEEGVPVVGAGGEKVEEPGCEIELGLGLWALRDSGRALTGAGSNRNPFMSSFFCLSGIVSRGTSTRKPWAREFLRNW